MKFFVFLLILFSNFCCFSQTKFPEEIKNFTGICCEFYPNGIISQQKHFKNGELVGEIKYYDEKGYLIINNSFDEPAAVQNEASINDIECFQNEKEAEFPGGYREMNKFFTQNLKCPKNYKEGGRVFARFIVEIDGSLTDIVIYKAIPNCPQCSDEVIRILKSMPKWNPAENNGKKVRTRFQIPFNFSPN